MMAFLEARNWHGLQGALWHEGGWNPRPREAGQREEEGEVAVGKKGKMIALRCVASSSSEKEVSAKAEPCGEAASSSSRGGCCTGGEVRAG